MTRSTFKLQTSGHDMHYDALKQRLFYSQFQMTELDVNFGNDYIFDHIL